MSKLHSIKHLQSDYCSWIFDCPGATLWARCKLSVHMRPILLTVIAQKTSSFTYKNSFFGQVEHVLKELDIQVILHHIFFTCSHQLKAYYIKTEKLFCRI